MTPRRTQGSRRRHEAQYSATKKRIRERRRKEESDANYREQCLRFHVGYLMTYGESSNWHLEFQQEAYEIWKVAGSPRTPKPPKRWWQFWRGGDAM